MRNMVEPKKAIDVSKHQGKINMESVKAAGIEAVMIRAGYGRYANQKDPQFERNASECERLGIPYGVYWYSYATTAQEARQEARCCLEAIKGKTLCLPVAYDIEYEPGILALNNRQRTELVKAFLGEIEEAGYYGILYASTDFVRNRLNYKELERYDVWAAQYGAKCTCPLPYGIWQCSSGNIFGVAGFGKHLDCNWVYKDYHALMVKAGLNGHKAEKPDPETKPNEMKNQKLRIGPVSNGDKQTIEALCSGLGLDRAGLYTQSSKDGMYTLDIGPVSSGDAWYIMRTCSALGLIEAGLYTAQYV